MSGSMPVVFAGHGSPMNALAENRFSRALNSLGQQMARPNAILCVSAHWQTQGTYLTNAANPKMIYDFHGFPEELYQVRYSAPGAPALAEKIQKSFPDLKIQSDQGRWGFDHGSWGVLTHLYPEADIPVLQLSLDMTKSPVEHLEIAKKLSPLRDQGVLILGSGNIVHNLRNFSRNTNAPALPWAVEFDTWVKTQIENRNFQTLAEDFYKTEAGRLSVADIDHYLPLLYVLGASRPQDKLKFFLEEIQNGSISMRSFVLN